MSQTIIINSDVCSRSCRSTSTPGQYSSWVYTDGRQQTGSSVVQEVVVKIWDPMRYMHLLHVLLGSHEFFCKNTWKKP